MDGTAAQGKRPPAQVDRLLTWHFAAHVEAGGDPCKYEQAKWQHSQRPRSCGALGGGAGAGSREQLGVLRCPSCDHHWGGGGAWLLLGNDHARPSKRGGCGAHGPKDVTTMPWTEQQQAALEMALRTYPTSMDRRRRWDSIATAVGKHARECLRRCRELNAAARAKLPPPMFRLSHDSLLLVLDFLSGSDLCAFASVCKAATSTAHDDSLWSKLGKSLPESWHYDRTDRGGEARWRYVLRVRVALHGAWRRLKEHQAGHNPYLAEIGAVCGDRFEPTGRVLPYRMTYGAVCELVMLQVRRDGDKTVNAGTYRAVAEFITSHSANSKSYAPPIHMAVREIYKVCYPGFGSGVGSTGTAPGVQAGGSSTTAGTSGSMVGRGLATMTKRVGDEELRKRLDTLHVFFSLINH